MKSFIFAVVMALSALAGWAQPVITSPTNGQVLYVGETINITWIPRNGPSGPDLWDVVNITFYEKGRQLSNNVPTADVRIASAATNSGNYMWQVAKHNTNTSWIVEIEDGGFGTNISNVEVTIIGDPRIQGVRTIIDGVWMVIEWEAHFGHTYRIESSSNRSDWIVEQENISGRGTKTVFIPTSANQFFRVVDLTTPPTEIQLIGVRKIMSISWAGNSRHTYRVESSFNLRDWTTRWQGIGINPSHFLFTMSLANEFFRVFDLTPNLSP